MRNKIILYTILSLGVIFSFAQDVPNDKWNRVMGGSQNDHARAIVSTPSNVYFAVGSANSTDGVLSGTNAHGGSDMWLMALRKNGSLKWQKCIGGTGAEEGIFTLATQNEDCIVLGSSNSNDGDVVGNHGLTDAIVAKYDSTGTQIWKKIVGGNANDIFYSALLTQDNHILLVGETTSNNSGDVPANHSAKKDVFLAKMDLNGNFIWKKCFGGTEDEWGISAVENANGDFTVLCTSFSSTSAGANGDVSAHFGGNIADIWLINVSASGSLQWEKSLGGNNTDMGKSLLLLANGSYMIAGETNSTNGNVTGFQGGAADIWLANVSANGQNLLAQKCLGGSQNEEMNSLLLRNNGHLIVLGQSNSADGNVSCTLPNGGGSWLLETNLAVDSIFWQRSFLAGLDSVKMANSVQFTPDNELVVAGKITSTAHESAWFLKMFFSGNVAMEADILDTKWTLYPNPSTNVLWLERQTLTEGSEEIWIIDAQAKLVKKAIWESSEGNKKAISIADLPNGLYILCLKMAEKQVFRKFVIAR
jgi:hypothetical protein